MKSASDFPFKSGIDRSSQGLRTWVFPDAELPPPGDSLLKGHESLIVLNMNPAPTEVRLTLYFADRDPVTPAPLRVEACRVRCFRLDRKEDIGFAVPLETQYALRVDADQPVVAQYGRLDTRQANLAYYTVMGYAA
jgi:hypothetical protein